jgi:hypothetical protein
MDQINIELKKWSSWFRANKMAVNVKRGPRNKTGQKCPNLLLPRPQNEARFISNIVYKI